MPIRQETRLDCDRCGEQDTRGVVIALNMQPVKSRRFQTPAQVSNALCDTCAALVLGGYVAPLDSDSTLEPLRNLLVD